MLVMRQCWCRSQPSRQRPSITILTHPWGIIVTGKEPTATTVVRNSSIVTNNNFLRNQYRSHERFSITSSSSSPPLVLRLLPQQHLPPRRRWSHHHQHRRTDDGRAMATTKANGGNTETPRSKRPFVPLSSSSSSSSTTSSAATSATPIKPKPNSPATNHNNISAMQLLLQKPTGTFSYPDDFVTSSRWVERIFSKGPHFSRGRMNHNIPPEAENLPEFTANVNAAFQLLERNVQEYASYLTTSHRESKPDLQRPDALWFSRITIINTLFHLWKDLSLLLLRVQNHDRHCTNGQSPRNDSSIMNEIELPSPRQLVQALEQMSILLPNHFHYDITTMNSLLTVLIYQASTRQMAPMIGEQLLDFVRAHDVIHSNNNHSFRMTPNAETYNVVIKAWIDSGLPETNVKIDQLLQEYHQRATEPSPMSTITAFTRRIPYFSVMEYYSSLAYANVTLEEKIRNIYDMMKENNAISASHWDDKSLSKVLNCVVKTHDFELLYDIFTLTAQSLLSHCNNNKNNGSKNSLNGNHLSYMNVHQRRVFCASVDKLIRHYRGQIVSIYVPKLPHDQRAQYLLRSKNVYQYAEQCLPMNREFAASLRNTMLDMYSGSGNVNLLEEFFHTVVLKDPTLDSYDRLITSYGNCNMPDRAQELVSRMLLKESTTKPTIRTINNLLICWGNASTSNHQAVATERAFTIFDWMRNNQRCIDLNIAPNSITFSSLLKCVVTTARATSVHSYPAPTSKQVVNTSIVERVETVLQEMDNTYKNDENVGTTYRYLVGIYAGAIKALLLANNYDRAEEILHYTEEKIYQQDDNTNNRRTLPRSTVIMTDKKIEFSTSNYIPFYKYYSQMRSKTGAQRAEKLHNHMRSLSKDKSDMNIRPDARTYNIIMNAWVESGVSYSTVHLWRIYKQMSMQEKLDIEYDTCTILVNALSNSDRKGDQNRMMKLIELVNQNRINTSDGEVYMIALKNCRRREDVHGVTKVVKLLIDSWIRGHVTRGSDRPGRGTFNWILSTYIARNNLESPTRFLEDLMHQAAKVKSMQSGGSLDVSWIGPDVRTMLELRDAWTQQTQHEHKNQYISKLDNVVIPAMMRLSKFEKGNIHKPQGQQRRLQQGRNIVVSAVCHPI